MDNESRNQDVNQDGGPEGEVSPIVFVNNPIDDYSLDIVGFDTQVKTIEQAFTRENATMIGIVADYGTGKSSVTDILCERVVDKPLKYPKPIKINMWDCLQKQNNRSHSDAKAVITNEINDLTKSFLFQLANGKNDNLASYINKRLSNNYGVISFGLNSVWSWIWLIIAGILYSLSKIPVYTTVEELQDFPEKLTKTIVAFNYLSPVLLTLAIIFAVIGISLSCIAFSHWNMQKQSKNDVNDIFDTYAYIIKKLKPLKALKKENQKKRLIIVEDLDRISDKSVIIGFLKELYRFQTSMEKYKNRFVFIISIKPEAMLKKVEGHEFEFDDDKIYSKLFDLVISLKPIHYDDYDSVLLALIESENDKKEHLGKIIGEDIKDSLPQSFKWIKKGTNLTIRDLKERLNCAITMMVDLKNRDYQVETAENFEACAAVSYLEHQFPNDYNALVNDEIFLSKLIQESYTIKNEYFETYVIVDKINAFISGSDKKFNSDFIKDLSYLIGNGIFDEDFRMYFYTYPKGSHIKTTEEKYICDLLKVTSSVDDKELEKNVKHVYFKEKREASGKIVEGEDEYQENNIVTKTIEEIEEYSNLVFHNDVLFNLALSRDPHKMAVAINKYILSQYYDDAFCIQALTMVKDSVSEGKYVVIESIIAYLKIVDVKKYFILRELIVKAFGEESNKFEELFFEKLITETEIKLLNNIELSIKLINPNIVNKGSFNYIPDLLNRKRLKNEGTENDLFDIADAIYHKYMKMMDTTRLNNLGEKLLKFMMVNDYIALDYFEIVAKETNTMTFPETTAQFLNTISIRTLKDDGYLKLIDSIGFKSELSIDIVKLLIERGMFYTPLMYCSNNNYMGDIEFDRYPKEIIEAMKKVKVASDALFNKIKSYIFENGYSNDYEELFK